MKLYAIGTIAFLSLIFQLNALHARATLATSTVQIVSSLGDGSKTMQSSGIVFRENGEAYAVAAEAKVFHSNQPNAVHFVQNMELGKLNAKLIAEDWARGFALLKLEDVKDLSDFPTRASSWALHLNAGDKVRIEGFPKNVLNGSLKPSSDPRGFLLMLNSDRHNFLELNHVSEVQGAEIDLGWIGGPVFSLDGMIVGAISNQYLGMLPGSATKSLEWKESDGKQIKNHFFISSIQEISTWIDSLDLNSLLIQKNPRFHSSLEDQRNGLTSVESGNLKFSEKCPSYAEKETPSGEYPIGGADGAGIGGGDFKSVYCKNQVGEAAQSSAYFALSNHETWVNQFSATGFEQNKHELWLFFSRNAKGNQFAPQYYSSIKEFFKIWTETKTDPVYTLTQVSGQIGTDPLLYGLRKRCDDLIQATLRIQVESPEVFALKRRIFLISKLVQSDHMNELKRNDLSETIDPNGTYRVAWSLFSVYPAEKKVVTDLLFEIENALSN